MATSLVPLYHLFCTSILYPPVLYFCQKMMGISLSNAELSFNSNIHFKNILFVACHICAMGKAAFNLEKNECLVDIKVNIIRLHCTAYLQSSFHDELPVPEVFFLFFHNTYVAFFLSGAGKVMILPERTKSATVVQCASDRLDRPPTCSNISGFTRARSPTVVYCVENVFLEMSIW